MIIHPREGPSPCSSQQLLNNDTPGNDRELSLTRQAFDAQLERFSALNDTIRRFPLRDLLKERAKLEEPIEAYKRTIRTSRKLPVEILNHIFLECLPTNNFPPVHPVRPPISLAQVCQRWRMIALNLPELWSCISIANRCVNDGHSRRKVLSYVRFVTLWFARASQKPLAISLHSRPYFTFTHNADYLIPRTILSHSESIRELRLKVPEVLLKALLGEQIRSRPSWARLEKVCIDLTGDYQVEGLGTWVSIACNPIWVAPNLKSVVWVGICADALRLSLHWTQLEELRLSWVPGRLKGEPRQYGHANISSMLQATRDLVSLEISTCANNDYLPDGWFGVEARVDHRHSETVLRHLTTLTLRETALSPIWHSILDRLQLPALHSLTYDFSSEDDAFPPSDEHPLVRFLQSQRNPILVKTFNVITTSMSPLGLVKCLRLMAQLETLCVFKNEGPDSYALEAGVQDIPLGDWVLEQLYLNGQESLCPKLGMVGFEYCEFTSAGLKAFVEGRQFLARTFWHTAPEVGFAPLRAVYAKLNSDASDFVPGGPLPWGELVACEMEEYFRELGVDARIRFQDSSL